MSSTKVNNKCNGKDVKRTPNGKGSRRKRTTDKITDGVTIKDGKVRDNTLSNDPSWYNMYPELVDSTARIPTGYPNGINYNIKGWSDTDWNFINDVHTMRLGYVHGIGLTENDRDPVNLAATKLYSYVRHANSGHSNYERTDLMLYFLSVIEAYNLIGIAIRAYGTLNMFNNLNRAMPKHVIQAMGWDYEDLVANAAILRTRINNAIARVNSLYVPTELNITKRWWWLNTTVFTDSVGPKAMNYVCTPKIYRVWEEMESEAGGYLKTYALPDSLTMTAWNQAISRVLDHILDSEDIGIMSGDILKAYGDKVFTLSMIAENYTTPFVYSEEILNQINNTVILARTLTNLDITQVSNNNLNSGLRYEPHVSLTDSDTDKQYLEVFTSTPLMSFSVDNPDNMSVMVASRNVAMIYDYSDEEGYASVLSGSEIFVTEYIYRVSDTVGVNPSNLSTASEVAKVTLHSRFDYCPLIKVFDHTSKDVYVGCSHYENVVPVDERTLSRMHDTALLSLFSALV